MPRASSSATTLPTSASRKLAITDAWSFSLLGQLSFEKSARPASEGTGLPSSAVPDHPPACGSVYARYRKRGGGAAAPVARAAASASACAPSTRSASAVHKSCAHTHVLPGAMQRSRDAFTFAG